MLSATKSGIDVNDRFWVRLAVLVWCVVGLATCGRALLIPLSQRQAGIYPVFARAGEAWREGADLYLKINTIYMYRYGPLAAVLLVPLGMMPLVLGSFVWRLANLVVLLAGMRAWERSCLPGDWTARQRALLYLLAAPLAASGLIDGQANPLVIGLLLLAVSAASRQHWNRAALFLMLPVIFKLYPIALALLAVLLWPRQLGWRLAAALLAGLLLPFALQDPRWVYRQYEGWIHLLSLDRGRQDQPLSMAYMDLRLLFRVWLSPLPGWLFVAIQTVAALGLAGLCLLARWGRGLSAAPVRLVVGLGICWMLVLGPATEGCTYVMLAPILASALVEAWMGRGSYAGRAGLVAAFVLLTAACAAVWFPGGKALHFAGPHPLAGLLVFAYLLTLIWREMPWKRWREHQDESRSNILVRRSA